MTSTLVVLASLLFPGGSDDLETLRSVEKQVGRILPGTVEKTVAIRVRVRSQEGYGSGAHIGDGYILTCAHVVEQARPKKIFVVLPDGTEHPARLLGMCALNDYALLRIDKGDFPSFEMGDSRSLAVGDWVGALGHPGGPYGDFQPSFSLGKVTGLKKALPLMMLGKQYPDAIQTNAQIYAGNSGGPLFDLKGRLIGINGAILLVNENAYAIPTHMMEPNLDALKEGNGVPGLRIKDPGRAFRDLQREIPPDALNRIIPPNLRKFLEDEGALEWWDRFWGGRGPASRGTLGIEVDRLGDSEQGVLVAHVREGGGAEAAGIKAGDRILAIDGKPVADTDVLLKILRDHRPGEEVTVQILRNGWTKDLHVKLGD